MSVESIDYDIILKKNNEIIGTGTISAFSLDKQKKNKIPFHQKVNWVPSAFLAKELVLDDKVFVVVEGKIRINLPKVKEYAIPFSQEVDIKDYVKQFATDSLPLEPQPDQSTPENLSIPELPINI